MCQHFGWTWDYLHNEIAYNTIQKILIDLPDHNSEDQDEDENDEEINIEEMNANELNEKLNRLF